MLGGLLFLIVTAGAPLQEPPPAERVRATLRDALASVEEGGGQAFLERTGPGDVSIGRNAFEVRLSWLRRATVERLTYRFADAEVSYRAILDGPDDAVSAAAWLGYADLGLRRGSLSETFDRLERVLDGAAREGSSSWASEASATMALVALRLGRRNEAFELMDQARALVLAGDAESEARVRCLRANLGLFGSDEELVAQIDSAVALARAAGARRLEAQCLANRGALLATRGVLDGAAEDLIDAAHLQQIIRDEAGAASSLQWLGFVLRSLGRYGEALDALSAAVDLGTVAENQSAVAWARLNLGALRNGLGDLEPAHRHLIAAETLFDATGDSWGRHAAMLLRTEVRMRLGDLDGALALAHAVESWALGMGSDLDRHAAIYLREQVHRVRGDQPAARLALTERAALVEQRRLASWGWSVLYGRGVLALGDGDAREALTWLDRSEAATTPEQGLFRFSVGVRRAEALVLDERPHDAAAILEAALDEFDEWRSTLAVENLRALAFQGSADGADPDLGFATVVAAVAEVDAERAFVLAERRRARVLGERVALLSALARGDLAVAGDERKGDALPSLARLQGRLRATGSAALSYVTGRGGEPTTLFVVMPDRIDAVRLAPIETFEMSIDRALRLLPGAHPGATAHIEQLHAGLLAPALQRLPGDVTRLVIIPEDILFQVPFAALQQPGGLPLAVTHAFGVAPSAAVLLELAGRRSQEGPVRLLAIADPDLDFDRGSGAATGSANALRIREAWVTRGGTPPLAGARREAHTVARYAKHGTVRTGARATERWLKEEDLTGYRVLHIATHALVDDASSLMSAVALTPDAHEDGVLEASEILGLQLGADLVVLSACSTARGPVLRGEGLQGLAAPVLGAGARALVATAWDVDDHTTARFMEDFYRALAQGHSVIDALAVSRRQAIERGATAASWAAFTVFGDPFVDPGLSLPRPRPLRVALWALFALTMVMMVLLGPGVGQRIRHRRPAFRGSPE